MQLEEVSRLLGGTIIVPQLGTKRLIEHVIASDLMSEVLGRAKSGYLLVTSLVNRQTVRTAEMTQIPAVCFVNGKSPSPEVIELAKKQNIALLVTDLCMFDVCGKLFAQGLKGIA